MKILVLGASGYVGRNLLPSLIATGHSVRCLVRDPVKINLSNIEVIQGDAKSISDLKKVMIGVDCIFYLIHSMTTSSEDFVSLDQKIATNVASTASNAGVERIIYLGALGKEETSQTPHLKSRHQVADILRNSNVTLTEFRAAVVVGNGSASFEMIKYLVNRLPIMICPKWINVKTQPIYIDDVIYYLINSLSLCKTRENVFDIGGPDILSYLDMMKVVSKVLKLRRFFFTVPVLSPKLSSHWVNLVTPISSYLASSLIESVRSETICESDLASELFNYNPISFQDAVKMSLLHKE